MIPAATYSIEDEFLIAHQYRLSPKLLKAVLFVESSLDHTAVNPHTLDFGIGQINYKTAEAMGMDVSRLTKDRAYSIEQAAIVLADFKKQFKSREPENWVCRYNVGWGTLEGKRAYQCEIYLHKIKLAMGEL